MKKKQVYGQSDFEKETQYADEQEQAKAKEARRDALKKKLRGNSADMEGIQAKKFSSGLAELLDDIEDFKDNCLGQQNVKT